MARRVPVARTLAKFAVDQGSPGRIFKLDEDAIADALSRFEQNGGAISVTTVAGVSQATWSRDPGDLSRTILNDYFQGLSGSERAIVRTASEELSTGRG